MVYFLAVAAGQAFSFALSARRDDADRDARPRPGMARRRADPPRLRRQDGGRLRLLRPAPRRAGRARRPGPERPPLHAAARLTRVPGRGRQTAGDCDLRPATLRGLLRWWWRTLHAGALVDASCGTWKPLLWGSTAARRAPIQLRVEPQKPGPRLYRKRDRVPTCRPARRSGSYGIPGADPRKTTQGLWYASFGMDDGGRDRSVVEPGAAWSLRLTARASRAASASGASGPTTCSTKPAPRLWLLCRYGGVGSKSRKGFGSLVGRWPRRP